jgi:hypothetical protein
MNMKKTLALLLLTAAPALAVPDLVSSAARIETDDGPFDGNVSVTFQIFDDDAAGTELWTELVASAPVLDGELVHELGSTEPLDDALLANDDLFLQVTINGDVLFPRLALRAVPFALKSNDSERLGGLAPADFVTKDEIAAGAITRQDIAGIRDDLLLPLAAQDQACDNAGFATFLGVCNARSCTAAGGQPGRVACDTTNICVPLTSNPPAACQNNVIGTIMFAE